MKHYLLLTFAICLSFVAGMGILALKAVANRSANILVTGKTTWKYNDIVYSKWEDFQKAHDDECEVLFFKNFPAYQKSPFSASVFARIATTSIFYNSGYPFRSDYPPRPISTDCRAEVSRRVDDFPGKKLNGIVIPSQSHWDPVNIYSFDIAAGTASPK